MKKFSMLLATVLTLASFSADAQQMPNKPAPKMNDSNDDFQWGIGLMGAAILGVVVGLTAASAASKPPTYSNVSE